MTECDGTLHEELRKCTGQQSPSFSVRVWPDPNTGECGCMNTPLDDFKADIRMMSHALIELTEAAIMFRKQEGYGDVWDEMPDDLKHQWRFLVSLTDVVELSTESLWDTMAKHNIKTPMED